MVQILVSKYGAGISRAVTALIVGTVVTFPICYFFMVAITVPLGLPTFLSVAYGFIVSVPICCVICNCLPWMKSTVALVATAPAEEEVAAVPYTPTPSGFFLNRMFGDVAELVAWGSSLAAIAMYVGATLGWLLNPLHPGYGAGNWPVIMCGQILTAALSVYLWYPRYKKNGWVFTFTSLIFASAIFVTYSNSLLVVIPTIVVASAVLPPMMDWLMKITHYKGKFPAIIYVQTCVGITYTLWSFFLMHVYIPMLGL